jgi:hypothetical protein
LTAHFGLDRPPGTPDGPQLSSSELPPWGARERQHPIFLGTHFWEQSLFVGLYLDQLLRERQPLRNCLLRSYQLPGPFSLADRERASLDASSWDALDALSCWGTDGGRRLLSKGSARGPPPPHPLLLVRKGELQLQRRCGTTRKTTGDQRGTSMAYRLILPRTTQKDGHDLSSLSFVVDKVSVGWVSFVDDRRSTAVLFPCNVQRLLCST